MGNSCWVKEDNKERDKEMDIEKMENERESKKSIILPS